MPKGVAITQELRVRGLRLVDEGLTYREVAERVGVAESTVKSWCVRSGRRRYRRYTDAERREAVAAAVASGHIAATARGRGIRPETVGYWVAKERLRGQV